MTRARAYATLPGERPARPRPVPAAPAPAWRRGPLAPADVLALQRTVGNAGVGRLLAAGPGAALQRGKWSGSRAAVTKTRKRLFTGGIRKVKRGKYTGKRRRASIDNDVQDTLGRPMLIEGYLATPRGSRRTGQSAAVSADLNGIRRATGKGAPWAGGHLIGDQFGGPDEDRNLVPVPQAFNLGITKQWESLISDYVKSYADKGRIFLRVTAGYPTDGFRDMVPTSVTTLLSTPKRAALRSICENVPDRIRLEAKKQPDGKPREALFTANLPNPRASLGLAPGDVNALRAALP